MKEVIKEILTMDVKQLNKVSESVKMRRSQLSDILKLDFSRGDIVHIIDNSRRNPIDAELKWKVKSINTKTISVKPVNEVGPGWNVPPTMLEKANEKQ